MRLSTALVCVVALAISGCFFGSDGDGGDPLQWVTLLADDFGTFPGDQWTVSGQGDAALDPGDGDVSPPSLCLGQGTSVTSAVQPFSTEGGVQFIVSAAFIGEGTCAGMSETGRNQTLSIIDQNTEIAVARLYVSYVCGSTSTEITSITYNLDPYFSDTETEYTEDFASGFYDEDFDRFAFIVWPDGTSEWRKNDIIKVSNETALDPRNLLLVLHGGDAFDACFDDVLVGRFE